MKVNDEEPLHSALSGKMRGLVPPQKAFFQVKTYSDNSILKCDSNLRVLCQDVLSTIRFGDLGFYALSAKEFVDDCLCSQITLVSGSSVSEAFSLSRERELARSSSSAGEEVSRARADLFMPAIPVSLSSVIFSSNRAMWGCATAMHIGVLGLQGNQGLTSPSQTTDSESLKKLPSPVSDQIWQHKGLIASDVISKTNLLETGSAHTLLSNSVNLDRSPPTKASLNIPDPQVSIMKTGCHLQGTTDPSFKMTELLKGNSLDTSATCNQYALYPTSKKQAAGKPGRFGFPSFPNIKLNRWGIPIGLGLYGGGESAANGWGTATSQPSNWGNNQSNQQGHWGGGGPNRASGPQNNNSPQSANLKPNQASSNNAPQQSTSSTTPPNNSTVNSNNQSVSSSGQQQSNQPITGQSNSGTNTWAQAAGKGLPSGNGSTDVQKLQSIKEALLSSEGWGGENVNQETHWDLPSSPEPGKDSATPHWKVVVNNGCDLWENNLRNGGAVPPKPQQAPWGQNPITNYGGTWGEEDDSADTSNVWTGTPSNPNPQWGNNAPNPPNMWGAPPKKTPEWGPNPGWGEHGPPRTSVEGASGGEWGPHKPGPHIGPHPGPPPPGPHHGPHPGAPHPGQHPGAHPAGPHPVNHPGTHPGPHPGAHPGPHPGPHGPAPHGPTSHGPSQHGPTPHGPPQHGPTQHGPSQHGPSQHGPSQHGPSPHGPSPHGPTPHGPAPHGPGPLGPAPHGPVPHGPGPLGPGPHGPAPHNAPGGPGQWNNIGKDIKPTGWEEPSPPSVRRDDGTAVWGNPGQQSSVSRWKDMPNPNMMGRPNMPNTQQGRLPIQPIPGGPMKTDQRMWGQPGRNGSWGEPHDGSTVWGDESKPGGWGDAPITSPSWASKPKTPTGPSGAWPEQDMDLSGWNTQNKVNKDVTKDFFNTKQHLRALLDIGYKKEEIEAVLRNNNIGLDETLMELGPRGVGGVGEAWRSPPSLDDHSSNPFPDLGNPNFQQQRFPPSHQQLPLNSQLQSGNGNQHVRALMHHIQLAAQAGYLNPQILNQPLAPNSLMLLNNMLSQISVLHKLMQQHQLYQTQAHLGKNSSHQLLSMSVHITKTKQQIQNLQNQIAAQQALYVKQQQQPVPQQPPSHLNPHISGGGNGVPPNAQNEFFKGLPEQLYANFSQMGVNEGPGMNSVVPQQQQPQHQQVQQQQQQHQQGSRLNQWKLPNLDSDDALSMINNDFVRAPGKPSMPQSQSSPNLNPLLPGSNSAWSLSNRPTESGWPDSSSSSGGGRGDGGSPPSSGVDKSSIVGLDSAWASSANNSGAGSYGLDIKPFEPGKQWMVKNIEDDPNITPGSVTRSPLSLGIKDSDLLTSITKTTTANTMSEIGTGGPLSSLSLSSNTWSFNPGSGQPSSNSPLSSESKLGGNSNSKSTWSEGSQSTTGLTSELWGAPGNKTRGPPPGMSVNNGGKQSSTLGANGGSWGALGRSTSWTGDQQRTPSNSALHSAGNPSWPNSQAPSTWLILKNLTPQIDGSTLKTLCMQHGPLINFHLSLNHGFALVNYGSREEAAKAQGNLNNCLLSNTTILAEFANDSDVKQLLGQGPPPTPSAPSSSWTGSGRGSTPTSQSTSSNKVDSWGSGNSSSLWGNGPSSSASLWGGGNLGDGDQHRATPSSLKSYLPDGLLTSESM